MEICAVLESDRSLKEKIHALQELEIYLETTTRDKLLDAESANYEDISRIITAIVTPGLVKDFSMLEERDFDKSDFQDVAEAAEKGFLCLKCLLSKLSTEILNPKSYQQFFIPILKLCATHNKEFMWSSFHAVTLSQEVVNLLLKTTDCCTVGDLLCSGGDDHPNDIFKSILLSMRSSLSKETWVCNPSVCYVFQWLLLKVKHPYLSDHLPDVLPPSLMFIDHHTNEKKVLGIECLHHVIDNIPAMELKMYGRADVVYDVFHTLIYLNEPDVIDVLYPCLLKFLSGQERNPHNGDVPRKWGRYDDIYHRLMLNLHIEERVVLCRAYSKHIPMFIEAMGITVVKHLKNTVPILVKCLATYDGPEEVTRINCLLALKSLVRVAWPRMEHYMEEFLLRLIYLMYDTEAGGGTDLVKVKYEVLELCRECLLLLKRAHPGKFQELTKDVIDLEDIPGIHILKSVFFEDD